MPPHKRQQARGTSAPTCTPRPLTPTWPLQASPGAFLKPFVALKPSQGASLNLLKTYLSVAHKTFPKATSKLL
eukprot:1305076-Pyramimonas_sp.AAC.1